MTKSQVVDKFHVEAEADLGNSNLKLFVNGKYEVVPNVFQRVYGGIESYETNDEKNVINLLDDLYVHITSKAIERNGSFLIGKRALQKGNRITSMNIQVGNKHEDDVPVVNVLGVISARMVQEAYEQTKEIPSVLNVEVDLITAIPASQHTPKTAKYLTERFKENTHVVIVHVGEKQVTVQVEFSQVRVTKEGATSLYAIIEGKEEMFSDFQQLYKNKLKNIQVTGDYFKDKKILHVDIGDGTTEYIYTKGLNPILDSCKGERRGIGHATEEASRLLNERKGTNFKRQQFVQIILDPSDKYHEEASDYLYETRYEQAQLITEDIKEKYRNETGSEAEIIAVYGGGSIALREELYKKVLAFCDKTDLMLFYVPEKYAINLNSEGMNNLRKIIG